MATLHLGSRQERNSPGSDRPGLLARIRTSRPVRTVVAVAGLALVLLVAGTVAILVELRARETDDAKRSLLNLNSLLAESTGRTLESVDLVLQSVLEALRASDIGSPEAMSGLRSDRTFQERLNDRVSGLPQINAISIVDSRGRLVSFSRSFPIPDIDLSDREHFIKVSGESVEELFVSEPVRNRVTNEWTVYLARRIKSSDGVFLGAVYGAIDLDMLERSYARLLLSPGISISVWRLDGTLLVRHPRLEDVGRRFDTPAFRNLRPDTPPVVYETRAAIDGQARIVTRHVVQGFPVATTVARTRSDVLNQSQRETFVLLIGAGLLAAAIVAMTLALIRQFGAYEAVARAEHERAVAVEGLGELETQLRQTQKLEVIGQLASGIAHDFNNLLTVVIGNLDRLSRRAGEDAGLARYVEGARSGAERAATLSRRLLGFARREAGEPVRLDVNATVEGLTDLLHQALGRRAVLELSLGSSLPPVFLEASGFETALLNLVVNARDAMPAGGTLTIATQRDEGADAGVRVTVGDTGTGMAPEVVQRAFEPFFTTKEAGIGTGLGLAQVSGFARQNGGSVEIDSRIGEGTRVTIRLPAAAGPEPKGVA